MEFRVEASSMDRALCAADQRHSERARGRDKSEELFSYLYRNVTKKYAIQMHIKCDIKKYPTV